MLKLNDPHMSKINWTALVMACVGLAASFEMVPADAEEHLVEATLILGPMLVAIFRTYFTGYTE